MTIGYFIDIFSLFIKFFAKVKHCRLQNTVESLGKLCYGRAYLDFSPVRLVFCGSPLAYSSTFCSIPVSNNLRCGLPNGIVFL